MAWIIGIGVFVVLLCIFPRTVLSLVAIAVAGIAGVFFYSYLETEERTRKKASVKIDASYSTSKCSSDFPLYVRIYNNSGDTVEYVTFTLAGYREGFSKAVYSSGYQKYKSDKIINDKEGWGSCWAVPKLEYGVPKNYATLYPPNRVVWNIENIQPRFR